MQSAQSLAAKIEPVRMQCRELVLAAAPEIVAALIQEAKQGSCQHAKFLFDLLASASKSATDAEEDDARPSLAEYLIEQLQLEPPAAADSEHAAGA